MNHAAQIGAAIGLLLTVAMNATAADSAKRYLIIHADDAGMSHSANAATIESMEKGIVNSASIMVPCPWFLEFAAYARQHPEMDFGVHLTLNCEWKHYRWGPVAPREKVPSLVDPDGYLWSSVEQVAAHAKAEEVAIEITAQVERARQFGIALSHLDTHMGALASRPDLLEVYVNLGIQYKLPVLFIREVDAGKAAAYPALAQQARQMCEKLEANNLPVLDRLVQFCEGDTHEERRARYLEALRDLPAGYNQLIVHCGYDDAELRAITSSAARRDSDRRVFTDRQVAEEIEKLGIELITWRQFRESAATRQ